MQTSNKNSLTLLKQHREWGEEDEVGTGEQRNRAATFYDFKKKRSRMGKVIY
jgi:hypothetical protein